MHRFRRGHRLEPEIVVEASAQMQVDVERFVLTSQRIQRQHRQAMRALAVPVDRDGCMAVAQRRIVIALGERRLGGIQACCQNASPIGGADVIGPVGVGLVLEDVAADESERLVEQSPLLARRGSSRSSCKPVEAVEIEVHVLDREPYASVSVTTRSRPQCPRLSSARRRTQT